MSWTYSGDPNSSTLDAVRFLIGDTDDTAQLVQNEEINWAIGKESNPYAAASVIASALGARYSKAVSKSVGPLRIDYTQRRDAYMTLAKELRSASTGAAARGAITPFYGGSEKVNPIFRIGMTDIADHSALSAVNTANSSELQ